MATTYLSKTFSGAGTSNKIGTFSCWFKRSKLGAEQVLFSANHTDGTASRSFIRIESDDTIGARTHPTAMEMYTTQKFRDTSAWYHLVIAIDTTQATASNRFKYYINGEQITSFSTETYPAQNKTFGFGQNVVNNIGRDSHGSSNYFDGSMSHVHWIDGTQYQASDFGETDSTTGEWKINTSPSVTYGTNGFFILKDGNSVTDQSGNSNNLTVGGGTLTQTEDTPSNNFATGNPIANGGGNLTFTNGNTTIYDTDSTWRSGFGGLAPSSGKYYFEVKHAGSSSNVWIGIMDSSQLDGTGAYKFMEKSRGYGYSAGGEKGNNNSTGAGWGASYTQNDIIGVAMDLDNNKIYFSKNGTWQDSGDPTSGATGTGSMYDLASGYNYFPATSLYSTTAGVSFNFGNGRFGTTAISSEGTNASGIGKFEYDVPTGYTALSTKGLNE